MEQRKPAIAEHHWSSEVAYETEQAMYDLGRFLEWEVKDSRDLRPEDKFALASMAFEYTQTGHSFELAWSLLQEHADVVNPYQAHHFAKAVLKSDLFYSDDRSSDARAYAVAQYITSAEKGLQREDILTQIVEQTSDDELKAVAATEAATGIFAALREVRTDNFMFPSAAELLLRLGVATNNTRYIEAAGGTVVGSRHQLSLGLDFIRAAADALNNPDLPETLRTLIVNKLVYQQETTPTTMPTLVVDRVIENALTKPELFRLVKAMKGRNRQVVPVKEWMRQPLNARDAPILVAHSTKTLSEFNKLVTEVGAWDSLSERMRFAIHAVRAGRGYRVRSLGDSTYTGYDFVAQSAKNVTKGLSESEVTHNTTRLDAALCEYAFMLPEDDTEGRELSENVHFWWELLNKKVAGGNYEIARESSVAMVHELRDMLPVDGYARAQLDLSLYKSGDRAALKDMLGNLTHYPSRLIRQQIALDTGLDWRVSIAHYQDLFKQLKDVRDAAYA